MWHCNLNYALKWRRRRTYVFTSHGIFAESSSLKKNIQWHHMLCLFSQNCTEFPINLRDTMCYSVNAHCCLLLTVVDDWGFKVGWLLTRRPATGEVPEPGPSLPDSANTATDVKIPSCHRQWCSEAWLGSLQWFRRQVRTHWTKFNQWVTP